VGQVDPTLIQERQGIGGGLGVNLTGIALQGCHTRSGSSIDAVVLAATATGELPNPCGRGRRNVEDDLAASQQPQCQMMPKTVGVLDRPGPFGPRFRPVDQSPVFGERSLDTE
jgi:hypothetical protein